MAVISLYHWDYDHRPPSNEPFHTFSIAIFQWQPKASGKGLKKVNASRVCGYAADPNAMYAKAQEICDSLNHEAAKVSSRPTWLQKQYSVPRPKWIAPDPPREYLDPSVVRSIRKSVMTELLLPAGFVVAKKTTYVRQVNDQIHLINFQGSNWGGKYTVNLGFHYAFIKPLFARKRIPLREFHFLDCVFQARIGPFLTGYDEWFEYGTDRALLTETFVKNVRDSLKIFSRYSKRWANPKYWRKYQQDPKTEDRLVLGHWHMPNFKKFLAEVARHS